MTGAAAPKRRGAKAGVVALMLASWIPASAVAQERHALVVSGVSGSEKFAASQQKWVTSLQSALQGPLGFSADRVTVLAEGAVAGSSPTRENVTKALTALKPRLAADDLLLIVLIGHGTFDGVAAKFNLVGPDMDANEWKAALDGIPATLVFVNTTSSSFPFVKALAGKNRIVMAATDSAAQKYATVFPEYFIEALAERAKADNDKNGRLSVAEVFTYVAQAVKQAFDQKGTLVTERPVFEDGTSGVLARTTYLDPLAASASANPAVAALEKRRIEIEAQIEQLKARKGDMPAGQYEEEFERLAIELAKLSAQIRTTK